jgi:hypothetical protein
MTAEQQARELLDRMGVPGALDMTAGDVGELANLIAERDHLGRLHGAAAEADEDMADHPQPGLAGGLPIDMEAGTFKMPLFTSDRGLSTRDYDRARMQRTHEPDAMPTRPECWDFAMDFLGDPEAPEIQAYVEALEAYALRIETELKNRT